MNNDIAQTRGSIRSNPRGVINYRSDDAYGYTRQVSGIIADVDTSSITSTPKKPTVAAAVKQQKQAQYQAQTMVTQVMTQTLEETTDVDLMIQQIERRSAERELLSSTRAHAQAHAQAQSLAPAAPATTFKTVITEPAVTDKPAKFFTPRMIVAGLVATVILASTGYLSIDTFITNQRVKDVVATSNGASGGGAASAALFDEGQDETEVTEKAVTKYVVAADMPRMLTIEKLGIKSRILPMSVNADGSIQAPINIFDSGWYGGSAKPGEKGAAFIDAHASGPTRQGLFAYLDTLVAGDTMSIERGDGTVLKYRVVHTETVPLEGLKMHNILQPYSGVSEGLNLMTCKGEWIEDQKTYDQRAVVYTERIE